MNSVECMCMKLMAFYLSNGLFCTINQEINLTIQCSVNDIRDEPSGSCRQKYYEGLVLFKRFFLFNKPL